jgi:hypothetical protein
VLEGVEGTSSILGNQAYEAYLTTEYKVKAHFNYFTYNDHHERKCDSIELTVQRFVWRKRHNQMVNTKMFLMPYRFTETDFHK